MFCFECYVYCSYTVSFNSGSILNDVVDGTGQIVLDDLGCTGSESRLVDCPHNGLGVHDCRHSHDIGVSCVEGTTV